jgi:hypothetical protein
MAESDFQGVNVASGGSGLITWDLSLSLPQEVVAAII